MLRLLWLLPPSKGVRSGFPLGCVGTACWSSCEEEWRQSEELFTAGSSGRVLGKALTPREPYLFNLSVYHEPLTQSKLRARRASGFPNAVWKPQHPLLTCLGLRHLPCSSRSTFGSREICLFSMTLDFHIQNTLWFSNKNIFVVTVMKLCSFFQRRPLNPFDLGRITSLKFLSSVL